MYNNVSVLDNHAIIQLVLNAPEDLLDQAFMDQIYAQMRKKAGLFGLDDIEITISVIPNRVYRYDQSRLR